MTIYITPVQSETMTRKEESRDKLNLTDMENYDENRKRLSWVTDNRKQRKKKKTYAEVLQIGCEKEGTFVVKEGINGVMNSVIKEIDTVGKVTPDLLEIYNYLLKSEQNSSSPMLNLRLPIFTKHPHLKMLVIALLKVIVNLMFALTIMIKKF